MCKLRSIGVFVTWLCVASLCGAQSSEPSSEVEQQLQQWGEQAQQLQQRGDYPGAIRQYKSMLDLRPGLTQVRTNLGLLEHLTNNYAAALADFQKVLQASPETYVANLLAGFDLLKLGQPQEALEYLLHAQKLRPKESQPALGLGQAYAALRQFDKANAAYYQAAVNAPQNSEAYYGMGITYLSLSQNATQRIKQVDATAPLARSLLGEALLDQENTPKAAAMYQALVDAKSLPNPVCWFLGLAYARQGKLPEAATEFRRVLQVNRGCLGAHLGLASLRLRDKDFNGALSELDAISQADPEFLQPNLPLVWQQFQPVELIGMLPELRRSSTGSIELHGTIASSLESWLRGDIGSYVSKQPTTAVDRVQNRGGTTKSSSAFPLLTQGHFSQCESMLQNRPNLEVAQRLILAECAFAVGDYRTTFVQSSSVLAQNAKSLSALYWRARSSSRLGIEALVRSVQADPESARAHLLLAETLHEKKDYQKAEVEYTKVLEKDPGFMPARLGLATVYWELNQLDKAWPAVQAVLHVAPADPDANYIVAEMLVRQHKFDEAQPYLLYGVHGRPEVAAKSHALLSRVYASQNHIPAALSEIQQALQEDSDGSFHYQMAQLYKKLGNEDAAAKSMQESNAIRNAKNQ